MGSRVFHLEEVLPRVGELNQGEKVELLEFRLDDGECVFLMQYVADVLAAVNCAS